MQQQYYDPIIGRFYSNDPVGFTADKPMMFNRYAYGNNNPYKFVDPDGNNPVPLRDFTQQMTSQFYTSKYQHAAVAHQAEAKVLPVANAIGKYSGPIGQFVGLFPHPVAERVSLALGVVNDVYEGSIKNTSGNLTGTLVSEGGKNVASPNRGAELTSNSKIQAKVNLVAHAAGQVAALAAVQEREHFPNN
jgi:hypothetical protein